MPQTTLEERIAALEGSYRELTKRMDDLRSEMHRDFDAIRTRITAMDTRSGGPSADIAEWRAEFRTGERWIRTLIVVNWLSIMAAIFLTNLRK